MKQLLVLRHAKSSWKDDNLSDFDRPLNKRGKRDAPRMGRLLEDQHLKPDLILTSAATRAKLTAAAVADSCGYDGDIEATRTLYMAMPDDYVAVLNQVPEPNALVLVVGHNPGIEDLIHDLVGVWERMPTAALAYIELNTDDWQSLDLETPGKLLGIWLPKELS